MKKCRICKIELNDQNWGKSNQKQGNYICNIHYNEYKKKLKRDHQNGAKRRQQKLPGYSCWYENELVTMVPLTQNKYAMIDIEDGKKILQYKWQYNNGYAKRKIYKNNKTKNKFMHHDILPKKSGFIHDHINGNGLDNRKQNLRHVTPRENSQNHQNKIYTSKYPGVCWHKNRKKWVAYIRINGKFKTLGQKDTEEEAYELYKNAVP